MAYIPVVFTPLPVPANAQAMNWNQLITLVCQYIQANISTTVSFFQQGATPPISDQGIFFNTSDNRFENWDSGQGAYIPISDRQVGEIYPSFVGGDDLPNGLVVLDGRSISVITGLSRQQTTNLQTLFGPTANLPILGSAPSFSGLPATGSFAGISNPSVQPVTGVFANLPAGNPPVQSDIIGLRTNGELLDVSAQATQGALGAALGFAEQMLISLNGASGPQVFSKVFAGYP